MGTIASVTGIAARRALVEVFAPGALQPDGSGGYVESVYPCDPPTWNVAITTAAPGTETPSGTTVQAQALLVVRGEWRPDIDTRTQLVYHGRRLYVRSVSNVAEAGRALECLAQEDVLHDAAQLRQAVG